MARYACSLIEGAALAEGPPVQFMLMLQEASLQQLHAQEQLLANCQQQLMEASLQLKQQRQKASRLSEQTGSTLAGLQSKVHA